MTEKQKKDFIDLVISTTLASLSGNMEAIDYLVDTACIRAISNDTNDEFMQALAMLQSVENLGKAVSLITDDVSKFCLEFSCFDKEDK